MKMLIFALFVMCGNFSYAESCDNSEKRRVELLMLVKPVEITSITMIEAWAAVRLAEEILPESYAESAKSKLYLPRAVAYKSLVNENGRISTVLTIVDSKTCYPIGSYKAFN